MSYSEGAIVLIQLLRPCFRTLFRLRRFSFLIEFIQLFNCAFFFKASQLRLVVNVNALNKVGLLTDLFDCFVLRNEPYNQVRLICGNVCFCFFLK